MVTQEWQVIFLNPLKDTYGYDDLARDYLSMTIPSQNELIGKGNLGDFLEAGDDKAVICACYMGYIAWKAAEPLKSRLKAGRDVKAVYRSKCL